MSAPPPPLPPPTSAHPHNKYCAAQEERHQNHQYQHPHQAYSTAALHFQHLPSLAFSSAAFTKELRTAVESGSSSASGKGDATAAAEQSIGSSESETIASSVLNRGRPRKSSRVVAGGGVEPTASDTVLASADESFASSTKTAVASCSSSSSDSSSIASDEYSFSDFTSTFALAIKQQQGGSGGEARKRASGLRALILPARITTTSANSTSFIDVNFSSSSRAANSSSTSIASSVGSGSSASSASASDREDLEEAYDESELIRDFESITTVPSAAPSPAVDSTFAFDVKAFHEDLEEAFEGEERSREEEKMQNSTTPKANVSPSGVPAVSLYDVDGSLDGEFGGSGIATRRMPAGASRMRAEEEEERQADMAAGSALRLVDADTGRPIGEAISGGVDVQHIFVSDDVSEDEDEGGEEEEEDSDEFAEHNVVQHAHHVPTGATRSFHDEGSHLSTSHYSETQIPLHQHQVQLQREMNQHRRDRSHFSIPDVTVTDYTEEGEETKYEHRVPAAKRRSYVFPSASAGSSAGNSDKKASKGKGKRRFLGSNRLSQAPSEDTSIDDYYGEHDSIASMERSDSEISAGAAPPLPAGPSKLKQKQPLITFDSDPRLASSASAASAANGSIPASDSTVSLPRSVTASSASGASTPNAANLAGKPASPSERASSRNKGSKSRFSIFGLGKKKEQDVPQVPALPQAVADSKARPSFGEARQVSKVPEAGELPGSTSVDTIASASSAASRPSTRSMESGEHPRESSSSSASSIGIASLPSVPKPPATLPGKVVIPARDSDSLDQANPRSPSAPSPTASSFRSASSRRSSLSISSASKALKKEAKARAKAEKEMLKELEKVNKMVKAHDAKAAKEAEKERAADEKRRKKEEKKTKKMPSQPAASTVPPVPPLPQITVASPSLPSQPQLEQRPKPQQEGTSAQDAPKPASRRLSLFRSRRMKTDPITRRNSDKRTAATPPPMPQAEDQPQQPSASMSAASPPPQIQLDSSDSPAFGSEWTNLPVGSEEQEPSTNDALSSGQPVQRQSSVKRALAKMDEEEERLRQQRNSIRRTGSLKNKQRPGSRQESSAAAATGPYSPSSQRKVTEDEDTTWVEEELREEDMEEEEVTAAIFPMITITEPDTPPRPREPRPGAVSSQVPRAEGSPIPEAETQRTVETVLYSSSDASIRNAKPSPPASAQATPVVKPAANLPSKPVVPHRRKRNADQKKLDTFIFPPRS